MKVRGLEEQQNKHKNLCNTNRKRNKLEISLIWGNKIEIVKWRM